MKNSKKRKVAISALTTLVATTGIVSVVQSEVAHAVSVPNSDQLVTANTGNYVIKRDGTVWYSGQQIFSVLGLTATDTNGYFQKLPGLDDVISVSDPEGSNDKYFVKSDNTLWAFNTTKAPEQIMTGVKQVESNSANTMILKTDGTVWISGTNAFGQLGNGSIEGSSTQKNFTQLNINGTISSIKLGVTSLFAIQEDGSVWAWGNNVYGNLGVGSQENIITRPTKISNISNVKQVFATDTYTVMLKNDGTVWTIGDNSAGQLGDGSTNSSRTFVQVQSNVTSIANVSKMVFALKADGSVVAWGTTDSGLFGNGYTSYTSATPIQIPNLTNVVALKGGIAIKQDGSLWKWGSNTSGQAGIGGNSLKNLLTPTKVGMISGSDITPPSISASYALSTDQTSATITLSTADDIGISSVKWMQGQATSPVIKESGTNVVGNKFVVNYSGYYSVLVTDAAGNQNGVVIDVEGLPSAPLDVNLANDTSANLGSKKVVYVTPNTPWAFTYKWALGTRTASYFSSKGTTFQQYEPIVLDDNAKYTVYVQDMYGNKVVKTITLGTPVVDTKLNNITLKKSTGETIPLTFDPATKDYTINLSPDDNNITATFVMNDPNNGVITGTNTDPVQTLNLAFDKGSLTKSYQVTTADLNGNVGSTYNLTIKRPALSSNADLSKVVTGYMVGGVLQTQTISSFNGKPVGVWVGSGVGTGSATSLRATPTSASAFSTITVNGTTVNSGSLRIVSTTIAAPTTKSNTFFPVTIEVTAEDGTKKSYQFQYYTGNNDVSAPSLSVEAPDIDPVSKVSNVKFVSNDDGGTKLIKWEKGVKSASYFATGGTDITQNATDYGVVSQPSGYVLSGNIQASESGTYTFYAQDYLGNETVKTVEVKAQVLPPAMPTLTADKTSPTNTDVLVTISYPDDVTVKEYRVNGGAWTSYTTPVNMTANGTIEARGTNSTGLVSEIASLSVSNIDKISPTAPTLVADKLTATNTNVTVTITYSSDSEKKYYRIDGGAWTPYTAPVVMSANGKIEAHGADAANNASSIGSLTISNIDKVAPTTPTISLDNMSYTNKNVTATITFSADSATKEYRINGGSWTAYTAPVVMTDNGLIEARGTDAAGNVSSVGSFTVANIERTAPTISLQPGVTAPAKQVYIAVLVNDNITEGSDFVLKWALGNQSASYFASSGTTINYGASVLATTNGVYTVYAKDEAGNETVQTINITNIDNVAPTTPTFTADKTAPTNGNVNVTVSFSADSATKEYRVNGGAWTAYTAPVVMTANGLVEARGTDAVGNVSTVGSYTVSNIDTVAPTTPTLAASTTAATKNDVTVTITYPGDASVKEYRVNGGAWTAYTTPVVVSANGTVDARATDAAGNVSTIGTINIANIDKVAPTTPTLTADKTATTNGTVNVTISFSADSATKEYRVNGGSWTAYTAPVAFTANGTLEARGTDAVGNVSTVGSYTVSNIDTTAPTTPTLTASTTAATKNDVTVTVTYPSDAAIREYRVNGGSWTAYTTPVVISSNGTVDARATDAAGNVSTIGTINIANIDKVAPTTPTFTADKTGATNGTVNVTISFSADSATKEYRVNGGAWTAYTGAVAFTANGTLEARGTDAVGNVSTVGSYTVNNIDTTAPTTPTLAASTTAATNNDITVTITYPGDTAVKEYRVNGGAWTAYTTPVVVLTNGTVEARATDAAGNVSTVGSLIVSNIDKTAPIVPTFAADNTDPTNSTVKVTITFSADSATKEYRVNGGAWSVYTSPVTMTANGLVEARGTDAVGNVSTVGSYTVSNIDKTAPTTPTLAADKTTPTNTDVKVTITYPSDAATKEYRVNGGTWTSYTAPVVVTANGTVEARATDAAGNVSAVGSLSVSNIDKTAPTEPTFAADITDSTNSTVKVTITFSADSVSKEFRVNGGEWTDYTTTVAFSENGLIEARGTNAVGNVSTVGSYRVSNIDKVAPTAPTLEADKTAPTNSDVVVTITYPADAAIKEYRVNGGTWTDYTSAVTMTENGTVEARATDAAGNISTVASINVSNIQKVPANATFVPSTTQVTKDPVTVQVTFPSDAVVKQVQVNDGEWTSYTAPIVFTQNGKISAKSQNAAGTWSEVSTYVVSNIYGNTLMTPQLTPDRVTKINGNVTVTITYPDSAVKKLVKIGSNGTYVNYTSPIVLSENATVYAKAIDAAGNESGEGVLVVSNIDHTIKTLLEIATQKVVSAETFKREPYITQAIAAVSQVDASDEKNDLIYRLDLVINALTDETLKDQLNDLLDAVSNTDDGDGGMDNPAVEELQKIILNMQITAAEAKVKYAEQFRYDVYINAARELVDALPDIPERSVFYDRLNRLLIPVDPIVAQAIKNADSKVKLAETYKKDPYLTDAWTAVNNLPDGYDKQMMTSRMNAVQEAILAAQVSAAEVKVKSAETYKRDPYITNAWTAVNALPSGDAKDALTLRMNNLVNGVSGGTDYTTALKTADTKVKQAESMKKDPYVSDAWALVNALPDGAVSSTLSKTALVARMKAVEAAIAQKAVISVTSKVKIAEKYKKDNYIMNAWIAVKALPDSEAKTALITRLTTLAPTVTDADIQAYQLKLAETAVANYERYRSNYYKKKAISSVASIVDGEAKSKLQARIDAVVMK